jgi:hypothetical protein
VDARFERRVRNEAMFRAVNREIEGVSKQLGDRRLELLCECGRDGCNDLIVVTDDVYDRVHEESDRFLVVPGHETPQLESVVVRTERYVVVDKFGEAEEIVTREPDPGAH